MFLKTKSSPDTSQHQEKKIHTDSFSSLLKSESREPQHLHSQPCALTTINAKPFKPFSPQLLPPSLQDKMSLHSRSPPSSKKSWTSESLMWRHCRVLHEPDAASFPLSAKIAAFHCLLFPLQVLGILQATPLLGAAHPQVFARWHHLPPSPKPYRSLLKNNSYSL